MVVVELGGGRTQPDAPIDHSVGLTAIWEAGSTYKPVTTLRYCMPHRRPIGKGQRPGCKPHWVGFRRRRSARHFAELSAT